MEKKILNSEEDPCCLLFKTYFYFSKSKSVLMISPQKCFNALQVWKKIYIFMHLKEVSPAHQGCMYSNKKNTIKTVIL